MNGLILPRSLKRDGSFLDVLVQLMESIFELKLLQLAVLSSTTTRVFTVLSFSP
jgi:hypothetical protein